MAKLRKLFKILLTLALLAGILTPAAASPTASNSLQPALLQLASQYPDQNVRVIVQSSDPEQAKALVERLGGRVLSDLGFIQAFVAELSAGEVGQLGSSQVVSRVSLDTPVASSGKTSVSSVSSEQGSIPNTYLDTLGVRSAWNAGLTGQGIGVVVVDSGVSPDGDLTSLARLPSFNPNSKTVNDVYGHGTHVAGIIAGNGADSGGFYTGIAPDVTLISLKISDDAGKAYESDTVKALQWVLDNKVAFNIRIVNLSINAAVEGSYHASPLDAACEILWFNGIVVVSSAGNIAMNSNYNPIRAAPANDPFIITVGASDEKATPNAADDQVAGYSSYGLTQDGFAKPDIVAPGTSIYSVLSKNSPWDAQYPDRLAFKGQYFRLSGTSMAAPMVTGAVALLLQAEPGLTPDQVKYRLGYASSTVLDAGGSAYHYLDVYKLVTTPTSESANTGLPVSQLLTTGASPVNASVNWNSVNWNSVNWNSVNWNSVNWNSVNWNSVNWNSVNWN